MKYGSIVLIFTYPLSREQPPKKSRTFVDEGPFHTNKNYLKGTT